MIENHKTPFAAVTNQNARPVNEDAACACILFNHVGMLLRTVVIADGVGGAARGGYASQLAVARFYEFLQNSTSVNAEELANAAKPLFTQITREISELSDTGSGTTFTAIVRFECGDNILCHIGDTRAYYLTSERCVLLTRDDSERQRAIEDNTDDDEGINIHIIECCLGTAEPQININVPELRDSHGFLVLTTDGVHDVMTGGQLMNCLEKAKTLHEFCISCIVEASQGINRYNGKPNKDNITIAVADLASPVTWANRLRLRWSQYMGSPQHRIALYHRAALVLLLLGITITVPMMLRSRASPKISQKSAEYLPSPVELRTDMIKSGVGTNMPGKIEKSELKCISHDVEQGENLQAIVKIYYKNIKQEQRDSYAEALANFNKNNSNDLKDTLLPGMRVIVPLKSEDLKPFLRDGQ